MLGFATGLNKRKKRKLYNTPDDSQNTQSEEHEIDSASLPKKKKDASDELQPEKKLSAKQKKRFKNFVERKAKESERVKIISSLAENALNEQQLKLMQSSKTLGQRESNKYKLRRMLQEERAGITSSKTNKDSVSLLVSNVNMTEEDQEEEEEGEPSKFSIKPSLNSVHTIKSTISEKPSVTSTSVNTSTTASTGVSKTEVINKTAEKKDSTYASSASSKSVYVVVDRPEEIQNQRLKLPIVMEEQRIMETINENLITILCGETGSGKTTQLPQFLYEAGFGSPSSEYSGMIGVTEPRRVAAISMSKRVAHELNLEFGKEVGYQIRYDAAISSNTKIKFATDGILLKEIQNDFLLTKYSAIIIDEAHERSLNTDILLGLLSKIVLARKEYREQNKDKKLCDLKLIIMSATLRVEDFVSNRKLFSVPPPVISIDSRQFPVSIHFSKHTPENYMEEAYRKVCKIHKKLPPGGILVFVTGQQEIEGLCRRLRKKFPRKRKTVTLMPKEKEENKKNKKEEEEEEEKKGKASKENGEEDKILEEGEEIEEAPDYTTEPLYVLPLYSMLNSAAQLKVFETPPEGTRLVVVATNVAETSLTIPGIKYVVDTGKVKELYYDKTTGITEFRITWTSQASANQRSGRAGRTSAGHCYRLYSSAVYANTFKQFSSPEIELMPIEGVILQMKSMGIDNIENFPFPSSPDMHSLKSATKILTYLGALDATAQKITELGNTLAAFPVSPRYAKMLILGKQGGCLPYIIAIVATLTVRDPILRELDDASEEQEETEEKSAKKNRMADLRRSTGLWKHEQSDLLAILRAIGAYEYSGASEKFCEEKHLHFKSMKEIRLLRMQLTNIINSIDPEVKLEFSAKLLPPTKDQELVIRQIICSGLLDQVAKYQIESNHAYYSILGSNDKVYIHPSSYLHETMPEYCVYREITYTSRPFMKGITSIQSSWLPKLAIPLCHFSKPLELPPPRYDSTSDSIKCTVRVSFGPHSWELPNQEIDLLDNDKFKYFAKFLLEGQIFPKMKTLEPYLIAKPNLIFKSYKSNKVVVLVDTLTKYKISTKEQLQNKWKEQPRFLISALSLWIDQSNQGVLESIWPPL